MGQIMDCSIAYCVPTIGGDHNNRVATLQILLNSRAFTWHFPAFLPTLFYQHQACIQLSMLPVHHKSLLHYNNCFTVLWTVSGTTRMSWYQKGKTTLDLLEQERVSDSGIRWAICKSAPHPRQNNHASIPPLSFYRLDAYAAAQPTVSKHWRHCYTMSMQKYSQENNNYNRSSKHAMKNGLQ